MDTEVLAVRSGRVVELREHWSDDDPMGGHETRVALRHDDGLSLSELPLADIVIAGPSRTSKTPISVYLAHTRGLKVALQKFDPYLKLVDMRMRLFFAFF